MYFGGLAILRCDRMGLGTLSGVSESPGVGLIGVFLQRLAEKQCVDTHVHTSVCECTRVFLGA